LGFQNASHGNILSHLCTIKKAVKQKKILITLWPLAVGLFPEWTPLIRHCPECMYRYVTVHISDDSIAFSIVAEFSHFSVIMITRELLHLVWWNFARTLNMYLNNHKNV